VKDMSILEPDVRKKKQKRKKTKKKKIKKRKTIKEKGCVEPYYGI